MRVVLLAFKEFPVKGSLFGLSLFVPFLVVPLGAGTCKRILPEEDPQCCENSLWRLN